MIEFIGHINEVRDTSQRLERPYSAIHREIGPEIVFRSAEVTIKSVGPWPMKEILAGKRVRLILDDAV